MEKNLFVYVTRGGSFYDRTNGKNLRLFPGKRIQLEEGTVEFNISDRKLTVTRYSSSNSVVYTKDITEQGMYLVSSVFAQPLVKSEKDVRNLYNRLKTTIGKPKFKLETNPKLRRPYTIKLHTWLDKTFNYRFTITTKDSNIPLTMVEEIYDLINKASKLDMKFILSYYGAFNNNEVVVTINENFFASINEITASLRETASTR
jgi:hypothetical protein